MIILRSIGDLIDSEMMYNFLMLFRSFLYPTYFGIRSLSSSIHHATKNTMLILSESDVKKCLDANRRALMAIAKGDAVVPTRLALPYHRSNKSGNTDCLTKKEADDWTLFKPAALQQIQANNPSDDAVSTETWSMGMKVVSIRAENAATGHPLVPATILHIDPASGVVDAVVAATYLTAARTAAGSALAIQHYFQQYAHTVSDASFPSAPPQHVVVFGAGLQAEQHIRFIAGVFDYTIPLVTIINRSLGRAESLQLQLLSEKKPIVDKCSIVQLSPDNSNALEETVLQTADVIVTCTNTVTPLWSSGGAAVVWKRCIISGIGSYTPEMQEVPPHIVHQCQEVWIDTPDAIHVGDLKPLLSRQNDAHIASHLLGSVLLNNATSVVNATADSQGPSSFPNDVGPGGLVFYKAVGTAIQDVLTSDAVVKRAKELGIGTEIDMA
jgi:ornithine cyclodeaminase/alanine dehydrogenase-like protein (mu-crystallin family)